MSDKLLEVKNLVKTFKKTSAFSVFGSKKSNIVHAVNHINFEVKRGEILGIIGESGSGKTTIARILMNLEKKSSGSILFRNIDLCKINRKDIQKEMQMIFQDPYDSFNPGMRIIDILLEPLHVHCKELSSSEKEAKVMQALEDVELKPASNYINRYPHELSGGQKQRISIARAIIIEPTLIIADEPTSMLDVSVRATILNLLKKLIAANNMTMIFITHDIETASYMCNRLAVIYKGKMVEMGQKQSIVENPQHPYTKALVAAVKDLNHFIIHKDSYILDREAISNKDICGCTFVTRCPFIQTSCSTTVPALTEKRKGHFVACNNLNILQN